MLPDKERGFMTFDRDVWRSEPAEERVRHYREFHVSLPEEGIRQ